VSAARCSWGDVDSDHFVLVVWDQFEALSADGDIRACVVVVVGVSEDQVEWLAVDWDGVHVLVEVLEDGERRRDVWLDVGHQYVVQGHCRERESD